MCQSTLSRDGTDRPHSRTAYRGPGPVETPARTGLPESHRVMLYGHERDTPTCRSVFGAPLYLFVQH